MLLMVRRGLGDGQRLGLIREWGEEGKMVVVVIVVIVVIGGVGMQLRLGVGVGAWGCLLVGFDWRGV